MISSQEARSARTMFTSFEQQRSLDDFFAIHTETLIPIGIVLIQMEKREVEVVMYDR